MAAIDFFWFCFIRLLRALSYGPMWWHYFSLWADYRSALLDYKKHVAREKRRVIVRDFKWYVEDSIEAFLEFMDVAIHTFTTREYFIMILTSLIVFFFTAWLVSKKLKDQILYFFIFWFIFCLSYFIVYQEINIWSYSHYLVIDTKSSSPWVFWIIPGLGYFFNWGFWYRFFFGIYLLWAYIKRVWVFVSRVRDIVMASYSWLFYWRMVILACFWLFSVVISNFWPLV